jgi:hypothetical protein
MSRSSWTSASLLHNTLRPYSHFRTFPTAGVSISIRERTSDNVQVRTACPLSSDEDHLRRNAESLFSSTKALSCKTIYTPFLLCHISRSYGRFYATSCLHVCLSCRRRFSQFAVPSISLPNFEPLRGQMWLSCARGDQRDALLYASCRDE